MHFLRNALDFVPRKVDDDCLQELRWLGACPRAGLRPDPGDRRDLAEARADLAAWIGKPHPLPASSIPTRADSGTATGCGFWIASLRSR